MTKLSTALAVAIISVGARICHGASAQVAYVTDDQRDVVSVFDTTTNTITNTIPVGPGIRPCGIALSPDGRTAYVANPSADTLSVIDLATLATSTVYLQCPADACSPKGVIVSSDGGYIYAVSEEFERLAVTEIDARQHAVTRTFRVNAGGVSGGCTVGTATADGRLLYARVVTASGFALSVVDRVTGHEITRLDKPPFSDVVSLPSGSALAAVTAGGVAIIDAATQKIERMIPIDVGLGRIAVSPDGATAYVLGSCEVVVVDLAAGIVRTTIPLGQSCSVWDIAMTPDGKLLLVADVTGPAIIEIDTATEAIKKTLILKQGIGSLAIAPDSATLYVANGTPGLLFSAGSIDRAGALLRVDLRSDAVATLFQPAGSSAVAATPDGDQLYVANPLSGEVVAVDAALKRVVARIGVASPSSVVVDPAGDRVFVGSYESGSVTVIDRTALEVAHSVTTAGPISALAIAPDGSRLYAATTNGPDHPAIGVIDAQTLNRVAIIPVDTSLTALAFSRDGEELYAAESQYAFNEVTGGVVLIDPASGRVQETIATGGGVPGLAVSPDGRSVYAPTGFCCLYDRPPELSVIDTASQSVRTTVPIPGAGRIAITGEGEALHVISGFPGQVTAISTSTFAPIVSVRVGVSPSDIAIARKPSAGECAGDCNGDGHVTVDDLVTMVNVALGNENIDACFVPCLLHCIDCCPSITVSDIIGAVNNALNGCGG